MFKARSKLIGGAVLLLAAAVAVIAGMAAGSDSEAVLAVFVDGQQDPVRVAPSQPGAGDPAAAAVFYSVLSLA